MLVALSNYYGAKEIVGKFNDAGWFQGKMRETEGLEYQLNSIIRLS